MFQRGVAQILVLLGILAFAVIGIGTLYFTKSNNKVIPIPTPVVNPVTQVNNSTSIPKTSSNILAEAKIHLADNPNIPLERIKLVQIIFRPKDSINVSNGDWMSTVKEWQIKQLEVLAGFWEKTLDNKTKISIDFYPQVIGGAKNADEYDFNSIYQDINQFLKNEPDFQKYFNKQTDEYLILFTFVLIDGTNPPKFYNSLRGSHFDNIGIVVIGADVHLDKYYAENLQSQKKPDLDPNSAHEMGHALGLQHSGDDPNIRAKYLKGNAWTSNCYDLMLGYGFQQNPNFSDNATLLDTRCIILEQRQLFFK